MTEYRSDPLFGALTGNGRVLVVDDEPVVRTLVRKTLEQAGYDVLEADNGEKVPPCFAHCPHSLPEYRHGRFFDETWPGGLLGQAGRSQEAKGGRGDSDEATTDCSDLRQRAFISHLALEERSRRFFSGGRREGRVPSFRLCPRCCTREGQSLDRRSHVS